ncbi:MAG: tRNA (cytidine(34)-2'-O)-methyltransferase [Sphaerochaetaceae bacterium]|nr:tRNA (cytidine(34)-2'-O)-methyltransferase [Sphaerochaetaceae bacterium]
MLHVVLFEPEIPQNTGNIARTCAATGAVLDLVEPLGFSIDEKAVRRAGLDYWKDVEVNVWKSTEDFLKQHEGKNLFFFTTKARKNYCDVAYPLDEDVYLVFGKESRGIEEEILLRYPDYCVRIPMINETRSLNLSNSAAIAVYEYYRQGGFKEPFKTVGELHRHTWEDSL